MTKRQRYNQQMFLIVLFFCLSGYGFWTEWSPYCDAKQSYQDLRELAEDESKEEEGEGDVFSLLLPNSEQKNHRLQSFFTDQNVERNLKKLQEINPEIVAWLWIPGSKVDYPVCRSRTDASYYLNHLSTGEENKLGALFFLPDNSLSEKHLLIFGHNMRSEEMFGSLKHFEEETYQREHPYAFLFEEGIIKIYALYSSYHAGFEDPGFEKVESGSLADLYEETRKRNVWIGRLDQSEKCLQEEEVEEILTLSTCNGSEESRRLVHYRFIAETKNPGQSALGPLFLKRILL